MCARTTPKYKEELCGIEEESEQYLQLLGDARKQLRVVLHRLDVSEKYLHPEQQEAKSTRIKLEKEEHLHIKEEEQPLHIQNTMNGENITETTLPLVLLKSEDEDKRESEEDEGADLTPIKKEEAYAHVKDNEKPLQIKEEGEEEDIINSPLNFALQREQEQKGESEKGRAEPPSHSSGQHMATEACKYTFNATSGEKEWILRTTDFSIKPTEGTLIPLHKFPRDDKLSATGLKNIKRDEKDDPSAGRCHCSLLFKESDFIATPTVHGGRQRKRLVENAVPTNFSHSTVYPPCVQEAPPSPKRSTFMASSTTKRSAQVAEMEHKFTDSDKFTSLEDLKEKIKTEMPGNYRISLEKDAIDPNRQFLTLFTYEPVRGALPAMANVLRIGETGSFVMAKGGVKIANSKLRHIYGHRDVFTRVSQVINALAFLNHYSVEETDKVTMVVEAVEEIDVESLAVEQRNLLTLVKAQLLLSQTNKSQRRYSSDFLIKCAILYRAGPKMYRLLNEEMGLILPSEETVRRVTKSATYRDGIDPETRTLFQAFAGSLSKREKVLHLDTDKGFENI